VYRTKSGHEGRKEERTTERPFEEQKVIDKQGRIES
jgi:hypothetical protein